jgi:excinuclease ABC subunit A
LQGLVDAGNTVILVEHDMRVAAASDWVIDMGPGAGGEGGRVVVAGPPSRVASDRGSRTARFLAIELGTAALPGKKQRVRGSAAGGQPVRTGSVG